MLRRWSLLYILSWKCASRHNGVQFFISHLASWLRTRRFSEPTFQPSGAANHWKNTAFRGFSYLFARLDLLSSETFSFLIFFLLFSSLTLPISAFLSVHIVGGLTSKLPSIMNTNLDNSLPARWGPLVLNFLPPPFLSSFCLLLLYTPLPARRQAASQAPDAAGPDAVGHTRIRTLSKLWMQLGTFGPEHILKKP